MSIRSDGSQFDSSAKAMAGLLAANAVTLVVLKTPIPRSVEEFLKGPNGDKALVGGATVLAAGLCLVTINRLFGTDPLGRTLSLFSKFSTQEKRRNINVDSAINKYNELHEVALEKRNDQFETLVDNYYELATNFYEWGWGTSFHFAYQLKGESFTTAIARHEYYLAGRLGLTATPKKDRVLDCGCGIGGPMRNIARFTGADITGVTLNESQVIRGNELTAAEGLADTARSVQANFMKMVKSDGGPFEPESFDGVYAIEATCHAPDDKDKDGNAILASGRIKVYGQIFKLLKPGKIFATYEWCLTPKYDPVNFPEHAVIKKKIEEGDGLPDMCTQEQCTDAIKKAGFELIEARDMALDGFAGDGVTTNKFGGDVWWLPLHPSWNPFSFRFQMTEFGKFFTRNMLYCLEGIGLAPKGTYKIQQMLQQGGWGCARGGFTGTFTPMWLMVARKPLTAAKK